MLLTRYINMELDLNFYSSDQYSIGIQYFWKYCERCLSSSSDLRRKCNPPQKSAQAFMHYEFPVKHSRAGVVMRYYTFCFPIDRCLGTLRICTLLITMQRAGHVDCRSRSHGTPPLSSRPHFVAIKLFLHGFLGRILGNLFLRARQLPPFQCPACYPSNGRCSNRNPEHIPQSRIKCVNDGIH